MLNDRFGSNATELARSVLQCNRRFTSKIGHEFKAVILVARLLKESANITLDEMTVQREALLKARLRGAHTVEYDGKRVTYVSDAEMAAALPLPAAKAAGRIERSAADAAARHNPSPPVQC
jgi:hypothetical protein